MTDATQQEYEATMHTYLSQHALYIATVAWQGYLQVGRGIVYITYDRDQIDYLDQATALQRLQDPDGTVARYLADYDPNVQFVLYFSSTSWGNAGLAQIVRTTVSPRSAGTSQGFGGAR